mgnify:CR=1 FL=1
MKTADAGSDRLAMAVLTAMVFCGAILLFGLEPLTGRLLTPYFGGAATNGFAMTDHPDVLVRKVPVKRLKLKDELYEILKSNTIN